LHNSKFDPRGFFHPFLSSFSGGQSRWPFLVILKQDMTEVGILIIFLGLFEGMIVVVYRKICAEGLPSCLFTELSIILKEQTPAVKINDACVNLLKRPSRHPY